MEQSVWLHCVIFSIERNKSAVPLLFRMSPGDSFRSTLERPKIKNVVYVHVTVHRNIFLFNNQPDALIIPIYCYKTLHASGILSAHHQEFSTVHVEFYDRINLENRYVWLVIKKK
jgi:hypothetical protein